MRIARKFDTRAWWRSVLAHDKWLRPFITLVLMLPCFSSVIHSQPLSAPVDHWYCAEFYQWAQAQGPARQNANEASRLENFRKRHAGFAVVLSGGLPLQADTQAAAARLLEALNAAKAGGMNIGDFFIPQSRRCLDLDFQQGPAINALARSMIHVLPVGRVDAKQIGEREAYLRTAPAITAHDEEQTVVYTLIHTVPGMDLRSDHIFTKPGHLAYPAVVSVSKRTSADRPLSVDCKSSFAGPTGAAQLWIQGLEIARGCNAAR